MVNIKTVSNQLKEIQDNLNKVADEDDDILSKGGALSRMGSSRRLLLTK